MAIISIEGFKVYDSSGRRTIIINSDCITECMQIYSKYDLDGVAVTVAHDYTRQDVDFLADYPDIRHLSISEGVKDIGAVHKLRNLESLLISGKNRKIDFAKFPLLKKLSVDWSPYFINMELCVYLESLSLYKFNPKSKDFASISQLPWLKKMTITQSTVECLNGLEALYQLEELSLNYCSKLSKLCCLDKSKETLYILLLDHCKAVTNFEYVTSLQKLKTFAFNDCGTVSTIRFIKLMASLESVRFVGTDVVDGDMSPCIGLRYAGFSDKKNFSHTMDQIMRLSNS